jgi:hypothetical protein
MLRLASARLVRRGYATAVAPKLDWSELASRVNGDEAKREVAALKKTLEDMKEQLATAAKARAQRAGAAAAAAAGTRHARGAAKRSPRRRAFAHGPAAAGAPHACGAAGRRRAATAAKPRCRVPLSASPPAPSRAPGNGCLHHRP